MSGDGKHIQLDQILFHCIQYQLDRFKIRQALFTNFFMFKHNVISHTTLEKLYDPKRLPSEKLERPKSINTRPYNNPIMQPLSDGVIDLKQFDVSNLTVSIGDEIEDLIFRIAEEKLTSNDVARIKQEPDHIIYKPSITELFHVQKLVPKQLKKLDIKNEKYDEEYVKSFREGHFSVYLGQKFRDPDVPDAEMITKNKEMNKEKIFKESQIAIMSSKYAILAIDQTFKYAFSQCSRKTLLIVGSAQIPPCYC